MIGRRWPLAAFAVPPVAIALFDLAWHEHWRDEAGLALLATSVPFDLWPAAMRAEGVPFLFHGLVAVLAAALPLPVALVIAGALGTLVLLAGTWRLLGFISGDSRRSAIATAAFAATYVYVYELGVVVRPYAFGLGLALLALASLRDGLRFGSRRDVAIGTGAAALAALTTAHSACVAGGACLAFALLAMGSRRGVRSAWPVLLAAPAFALTLFVALPFAGRFGPSNGIHARPALDSVHLATQAFVAGASPVDWWYAAVPPFGAGLAEVAPFAGPGLFLALGVASTTRAVAIARRETEAFDLLAVAFGWCALGVIFTRHYWGFARHHVFAAFPAIVVVVGWSLSEAAVGWRRIAQAIALVLAAPWFALQALLAVADLERDARYTFADTKGLALSLPPSAHLVAERDWAVAGVLLWRPDLTVRAVNGGGRTLRFIMADQAWEKLAPIVPLVWGACRDAPDDVFFAGATVGRLGPLTRCAASFALDGDERLPDLPPITERVDVWHIDCACVHPPPRARPASR